MSDLQQARHLAGLYALRDHYDGRAVLPADSTAKIDALFRPFRILDGLLRPILGLEAAIAELEAQFPTEARAAHLTHVAPQAGLC